MIKPELPRLAVLGAGPIGLEMALYARRLGYPVTVYERGRVGQHSSIRLSFLLSKDLLPRIHEVVAL